MFGWQFRDYLEFAVFVGLLFVTTMAPERKMAFIVAVVLTVLYAIHTTILVQDRNSSLLKQQESAEVVRTKALELSNEIETFVTEYDQKETEIVLQYKTLPLEWKRIAAEQKTAYDKASEEYSRRFDGRVGQTVEKLRQLKIVLQHDPTSSFGDPVHPEAWRTTAVDLNTAANKIPPLDGESKPADWWTIVFEVYVAIFVICYVPLFVAGWTGFDLWSLFDAWK
jgi:hypothetical protein